MNAELPPFRNGKHNSEGASTLDHDVGMRIYGGYVYGLHDGEECRDEQQRAINI